MLLFKRMTYLEIYTEYILSVLASQCLQSNCCTALSKGLEWLLQTSLNTAWKEELQSLLVTKIMGDTMGHFLIASN